jgi:S1-C subfamily serine protease
LRRGGQRPAGRPVALIVGLAGGAAALALIIGLFIWGWNRGTNAQAVLPPASQAAERPGDPPRTEPAKDTKPTPEPKTAAEHLPPGDTSLPADVLRRVKAATVYVKVHMGDGRSATGSGFFEQSTALILTNAHVVGMLREGAPRPRKVEAVLNSGVDGETTLPAELVSIDREADLAMLRVQLSPAQADSVPRLAVAPANDLLETQPVYVIGFPFGEDVNRGVTVSATTISSLHHSADGTLTKVQVNGGMHPGNSGGPVIDGRGRVIGVAVSGILGTQINFAIPGETVAALVQGRVAEVHVATDALARDGKVVVPVRVLAIDPRRRINRIAMDYWTGPERLPPADRPPKLGELTTPRQTAEVKYDAERGEGRAELVLDAMPARGMQLWVQPVVTNGTGEASWLAGNAYALAPPVDEKPTTLAARHRVGRRNVELTSTARFKLEGRAGREQTYVQNLSAKLIEQTQTVGFDGAHVLAAFQKFEAAVTLNGAKVRTSDRFQVAVRQDIAALLLDLRLDGKGNLVGKKSDLTRVPLASRDVLQAIGEQITQSLDIVAIPQPGEVKPGQTWQAKRDLPLDMPDSFQTAVMQVTYTYRGLRDNEGRKVAVLELRGALVGDRGNEGVNHDTRWRQAKAAGQTQTLRNSDGPRRGPPLGRGLCRSLCAAARRGF